MPLPAFNEFGDLPEGIHEATFAEVIDRFGGGTVRRIATTERLRRIHQMARQVESLDRFLIFGSYISHTDEPNDVDIVLIMRNDFRSEACPVELAVLFDHARADDELGASIFWVRPDMLLGEPFEEFLSFWQNKRDGRRRGIVEVTP